MKLQHIRFLLPLLLLGLAVSGCGSKSSTAPSVSFEVLDKYALSGSASTTVKTLTGYTVYCPETLTANHPVLTWGNGTGVATKTYAALLKRLASYGFVVVCTDSTQTGDGKEMIAGIDLMAKENQTAGSFFYQKLNMNAVGAFGHSQGGMGTLNAATDPRVKCAAPLMPGWYLPSGIKGSLFLVTASNDTVCATSTIKKNVFDPFTGTVLLAELQGVDHGVPCGINSDLLKYVTAWFELNLNNKTSLNGVFFGSNSTISQDAKWKVYVK